MSRRRARAGQQALGRGCIAHPRCHLLLVSGRRCALMRDHDAACSPMNDDPRTVLVGQISVVIRRSS